MTIDLPTEIEAQLKEDARLHGISVGQYVETLVAEARLRGARLAEFQAALAERVASLDAGERVDGEEVMSRLIAELG